MPGNLDDYDFGDLDFSSEEFDDVLKGLDKDVDEDIPTKATPADEEAFMKELEEFNKNSKELEKIKEDFEKFKEKSPAINLDEIRKLLPIIGEGIDVGELDEDLMKRLEAIADKYKYIDEPTKSVEEILTDEEKQTVIDVVVCEIMFLKLFKKRFNNNMKHKTSMDERIKNQIIVVRQRSEILPEDLEDENFQDIFDYFEEVKDNISKNWEEHQIEEAVNNSEYSAFYELF